MAQRSIPTRVVCAVGDRRSALLWGSLKRAIVARCALLKAMRKLRTAVCGARCCTCALRALLLKLRCSLLHVARCCERERVEARFGAL